jgi:hypothetical protein
VGFGVDVLAMAGFNLMGSRADDYARSGLLPVNPITRVMIIMEK